MQFRFPVRPGLFVLFFAFASLTQITAQEVRPRVAPNPANKVQTSAQQRESNVLTVQSVPRSTVDNTVMSRPRGGANSTLTNDILVRPTVSSQPVANATANKSNANSSTLAAFRGKLLTAMNSKLGIPYLYGSEGPNIFDCSGLIWTVFNEAGISLERTSAAAYWTQFEPATEEEKTQFGTLIFFNGLGHVGIVIDENTFYHASSSKGVTYSKLQGYWAKRIVGYRKIPLNRLTQIQNMLK